MAETSNNPVQGRSYTSNTAKLLKHMDKLQIIQNGGTPSPVMFHLSPINACNLTCSFCCFANRNLKQMLSLEQIKIAVDSFVELGTRAMELTGGGEPSLHPQFDKIVEYAYNKGMNVGVCTNGTTLRKWQHVWPMVSWIRLGMYGFDEGYVYDINAIKGSGAEVSAAYVWDMALGTSGNPNVKGEWDNPRGKRLSKNIQNDENFFNMLTWVEDNNIPTRIAFNAIKEVKLVETDMQTIKSKMNLWELKNGRLLQHAFLSDFNYQGHRRNDNCYMHMVKPFVFTDGNVYVCPSAELSPENRYNVNEQFKICDIDGIVDFYKSGVTTRKHPCRYCKYAKQNELIDDVLMETRHNEFA